MSTWAAVSIRSFVYYVHRRTLTALLCRAYKDSEEKKHEYVIHAIADHSASCITSKSHSSVASMETSRRLSAFTCLASWL